MSLRRAASLWFCLQNRFVTRPSPTRSGLARDHITFSGQHQLEVLCSRALVELVFDRQARSGAVCKARSSTAQGAHETVVKGLSDIRPRTARVLVGRRNTAREVLGRMLGRPGTGEVLLYTPHPTCPAAGI